MDNNAAMLFRPPNELLQKMSQEMFKIGEIVKFQAWQSSSFQRLRKVDKKIFFGKKLFLGCFL